MAHAMTSIPTWFAWSFVVMYAIAAARLLRHLTAKDYDAPPPKEKRAGDVICLIYAVSLLAAWLHFALA